MKKRIILLLGLMTILCIGIRIYYDLNYHRVALLVEYHDLLEDYQLHYRNETFLTYLLALKNKGLFNCFKKPSRISHLLSDYPEIHFLKGVVAVKVFPRIQKRLDPSCRYLIIPDRLGSQIKKLPPHKNKIYFKSYSLLEYSLPLSLLLNCDAEYDPPHIKTFKKAEWNFFFLADNPVKGKIDSYIFFIKDKLFINNTVDDKALSLAKAHSYIKFNSAGNEMEYMVRQNQRAILERNVKVLWLEKMFASGKTDPSKIIDILNPLLIKINHLKFQLTSLSDVLLKRSGKKIFVLFRYATLILVILYIISQKSTLLSRTLQIIILLVMFALHLLPYVVFAVGMIMLNAYFLKLQKKKNIVKDFLTYLAYLFFLCFLISTFIYSVDSYLGLKTLPGVKIIFFLPFLITLIQIAVYNKKLLLFPVKYKDLAFLSILGLVLIIAVIRLGNVSSFSSPLEIKIRDLLEKIFIVRPRFKEIFGYTFLSLLFFFYKNKRIRENAVTLYILGLVGVATTFNSFLHIHTPILITLIRSFYGIGTGCLLSLLIYYISQKVKEHEKNILKWISGL